MAGDVLPEGSALAGEDDEAGILRVMGPNGQVVPYHISNLSDGDLKTLGISSRPPTPAATAAPADVAPPQQMSPWLAQPLALMQGAAEGFNRNKSFGPDAPVPDGLAESQHPGFGAAGQMLGGAAGGANTLLTSPGTLLKHVTPEFLGGDAGAAAHQLLPTMGRPTLSPGELAAPPGAAAPGGQGMPAGPPGRPGTEIPRMQLHGRGPLAPDPTKASDAAYDAQGRATEDLANVEAGAAGEKASNAATQADQRAQAYAQQQQQRQAMVDEYKNRMSQLDKAQASLDEQKEDPNRLWNSWGGGQKAAAIVSQILGGFGQAFTGVNGSPIQRMMDQDIEAQRQNYTRAKDSLASKRTAYAQLREQGLSDNEAAGVLKLKQLDALGQSVDAQIDARTTPKEVLAKAAAMKAEIQQKKVETSTKLQQEVAATAQERAQTRATNQSTQIQGDQYELQKRMIANGQLPPAMAGRAVFVRGPDGSYRPMLAPDEKSAEKLKDMYGASEGVLKDINEAKQLAAQWGSSSDKTQVGKAYKAKLDGIIAKLNHAQGINQAVDENQRKLLMETFGNETTTPTGATQAGLEGLAKTLHDSVNSQFTANGLPPAFAEAPPSLQPMR